MYHVQTRMYSTVLPILVQVVRIPDENWLRPGLHSPAESKSPTTVKTSLWPGVSSLFKFGSTHWQAGSPAPCDTGPVANLNLNFKPDCWIMRSSCSWSCSSTFQVHWNYPQASRPCPGPMGQWAGITFWNPTRHLPPVPFTYMHHDRNKYVLVCTVTPY